MENIMNKKFKHILSITFLLFFVSSNSYAGMLDDVLNIFKKDYSYNVLFYTPDGREHYIGKTKTIAGCQVKARAKSYQKDVPNNYICCKSDKNSFCISKHR